MAKVIPVSIIRALSGRYSKASEVCFQTNGVTGRVYTTRQRRKKRKKPSPAQLANRERFRKAQAEVSAWIKAHKGSPEYETLFNEFKSQHSIGSFVGYLMHRSLET